MPKIPHVFYVFIAVFILFFSPVKILPGQAQSLCSDGSWAQPTCDPTSQDPDSCNILPPLFSGANCLQTTGYLRIRDEVNTNTEASWVDISPGIIQLGEVQSYWKPLNPMGAIIANGPIISGQFSSGSGPPGGFNASGAISAAGSIYAKKKLRVEDTTTLNSPLFVKGVPTSVGVGQLVPAVLYVQNNVGSGSDPTMYVEQVYGSTGNILYLDGRNGDVYFDAAGYMNAPNDYFINSDGNLQVRIDANGDGANSFTVNNGANRKILGINETGDLTVGYSSLLEPGSIYTYGDLSAQNITAYGSSGRNGGVLGNFLQFDGTSCSAFGPEDQVLVYNNTSDRWECKKDSLVGGGDQDLLSVLNTGSNASAFTGTSVFGGDLEIKANATNTDATLTIFDESSNDTTGSVLGEIKFGDNYGGNQAKVRVERGASGSVGDYPTNLSFWTTPDGSASPAQRLTVNYNGYVGIGTTNPASLLHVSAGTSGDAGFILEADTDNSGSEEDNPYINFRQDGGNIQAILGLIGNTPSKAPDGSTYTGTLTNSLLLGNRDNKSLQLGTNNVVRMTIKDSTGDVGIGTNNPTDSLEISRNGNAGLTLRNTNNTTGSAHIELRAANSTGIPFIDFTQGDLLNNNPDYSGRIAYWTNNEFQIKQNANAPIEFWTGNGTSEVMRMTIEGGSGYVGIGVADPVVPLHLATSAAGSQNILRVDGPTAGVQLQSNDSRFDIVSYGGTAAGYDTLFLRTGANGIWIDTNGNVNLGAANPTVNARLKIDALTNTEGLRIISSSYSPLVVRNSADTADLFRVDQNGDAILSGKLTLDKLQVNTIDPVYTIRGEKYATYVPGMTGVKEETTGLIKLVLDTQSGLASASLDFNSLDKGSDLWLFAQTINYQDNFDKIVVLLTPAFDGRVWYEKDETTKTLTIIAKPIDKYSQEYEVSYRFTGPRFDYKKWPNESTEGAEGLNLDKIHAQ